MQGISSKAAGGVENKKKFNKGTELNSDFDINLYETTFRGLDPQLGRFWQIDPLATSSYHLTPYNFGANNPILRNDPLGLKDTVVNGEHGLANVTHDAVKVTAYTPKSKQRIYWALVNQGIPFSRVKDPNLKEWLYRWDKIQHHLDRIHQMQRESDLYVWGTFLSPLMALFAAEVAVPMIYQGGQWLVRVGTEYVPWDKVSGLYQDASLWVYEKGNIALNALRREYLFTMAAIFKDNLAKVDKLMKQSDEFKDMMGPIIKAVENIGKKPSPSGAPLPTIDKTLNH